MIAIALIALFAACDRFAGGGLWDRLTVDNGGFLRGRPVWYAAAFLALILTALGRLSDNSWSWGLIALAWFVWREPKWKMFGGSLTPKRVSETVGFAIRHLLFLGFVLAAWRLGKSPMVAAAAVMVWAVLSALLGIWLRIERDEGKDINGTVETVRGALQGVAVAFVMEAG